MKHPAKIIILSLIIVTILISIFMFSNLFGGQTSQKLFEQGLNAYEKGNAELAVDKFSEAIKKEKGKTNPDKQLLSNIHNMRGEVYLNEGVAVLSQSDFAYALDYNSSNESALNNLGVWFASEQFSAPDYKKSLEYFEKAIKLRPDRKDIILNRAVIKIQSGDKSGCDDLKKLESEGYPDAKIGLEQFCTN